MKRRVMSPAGFPVPAAFKSFSRAVQVGDQIFISGHLPVPDGDDDPNFAESIDSQTRFVFEDLKQTLAHMGASLDDLVRLNTYYVYNGNEHNATAFWEGMTRVRLEYLPDPGPVGTAVRVSGMPHSSSLIQIDGVALDPQVRGSRQRIMPPDSWDWSIPVPLSQGWKIGNRIFVGGQISADRQGKAVAVGDVRTQTKNVFAFVSKVLEEGGGSLNDIAYLKLCYKHKNNHQQALELLTEIFEAAREYLPVPEPSVSMVGIDLLYEGLMLEVDGMAVIGEDRASVDLPDVRYTNNELASRFPLGSRAGSEIYLGGQLPLDSHGQLVGADSLVAQASAAMNRLMAVLASAGFGINALVKLNVFYIEIENNLASSQECDEMIRVIGQYFKESGPAFTTVKVNSLPYKGALVQIDGVAVV